MSQKQNSPKIGTTMRQALANISASQIKELYNEEVHRKNSTKKNTHGDDPFRFDDDKATRTYEEMYSGRSHV